MNSKKTALYNFIIILTIVSCILLSIRFSHGTDVFSSSVFMDLKTSIEELSLKVERASPGIVSIVVYDNTGSEKGITSGFFIDRKGLIMTNALVMKGAYSAEVYSESNYYNDVTILSRNEDLDLALIQVKAINESALEFDFEYKLSHGERVIAIGKSRGLKKTVSEGLISAVSNIKEKLELIKIQTVTPILSYNTSRDGPLLNMEGRVIGVLTTAISEDKSFNTIPWISDDQNINAIGGSSIKTFLLRQYNVEHLHPPKSKVWSRWFIKWSKTVAINGFITLYETGFTKILAVIFAIILFISLIQWLYSKMKKNLW